MDQRILFDYLRRYGWGFLILVVGYSGLSVYVEAREPVLLLNFTYLSVAVAGWYFAFDMYRLDVVKTILVLPLTRNDLGRSLWFLAVFIPMLIGCSVLASGLGMSQIFHPTGTVSWEKLGPCFVFSLLFGGSFFLFLYKFRWWEFGTVRSFFYVIGFVGYCAGIVFLSSWWHESAAVKGLVVMALAAATVGSYVAAPRFVENLAGRRPAETTTEPQRDLKNQDLSIGWLDILFGNPFAFVVAGSLSLIGLFGLFYGGFNMAPEKFGILASSDKPLIFSVLLPILIFLVSIAVFVMLSGAWIGSIRALVTLPISRAKLIAGCLVLPFIALSPVAVASAFLQSFSTTIYFAAAGLWLTCNAVLLRWNKMAAILTINLGLLITASWTFTHAKMARLERPEMLHLADVIGVAFIVTVILGSSIWTWWLLRRSSQTFRKKAEICFGL